MGRTLASVALLLLAACGGSEPTASGGDPVPFRILVAAGNQQRGVAGDVLPQRFAVQVLDQRGQPTPSVPVDFTVSAGTGRFEGAVPVMTDAQGRATAPPFRLGREVGTNTVRVTAGERGVDLTATAESGYQLEVRFVGTADPQLQQAFTAAASRVRALVVGPVPPVRFQNEDLSSCGSFLSGTRVTETIPGLVVYARVSQLAANIVGSAGPCFVREPLASDARTVIGVMNLNSSFLSGLARDGRLLDTVMHEMLHVLGVGTLWDVRRFVADSGLATWRYIAPRAQAACVGSGGAAACATGVPIEADGGEGTRGGHWRRTVFGTELMTGFIQAPGVARPLSAITARSLEDLGYAVNQNVVDAYTLPSPLALLGFGHAVAVEAVMPEPALLRPRAAITTDGAVRRLDP